MGIGFAFVKGLVQGANDFQAAKAEERAQKAADEKERLDSLGKRVFEAIEAGTLDPAKAATFFDLDKDQQTYASLAGMMVQAQDIASTTQVGSLAMPWNHSDITFDKGRPDLEITSLERHLSEPKNMLAMINEAKVNSEAVYNYFNRTNLGYHDFVAATRSVRAEGPGTEIKQLAVPSMENFPNFMKVFDTLNAAKNNSSAIAADSDKVISDVTEGKGVPTDSVVVKIGTRESINNDLETIIVADAVVMPLNTDDSNIKVTSDDFNLFATTVGQGRYESGSHMMLDTDFITSITLSSDPKVQFKSLRDAASLTRYSPQDLDTPNAVPTNNKTEMGVRLEAISGSNRNNFYSGDIGASVRAMVPHVYIPPEPVSGLLAQSMTGAQLLESKNIDSKVITEGYTAASDAELMIIELNKLEASLLTTPGFVRGLQKTLSGIVSEGGTLDQIFGVTAGFEDENSQFTTNLKEGISMGEKTTPDSLKRIALSNGIGEGSFESTVGRIDTLRINLAMKIARAADPAGRLSNQDFDNALKTLGDSGFFQTKDRQMAGLNQTLRHMTRKRESLEPYYKLLSKETVTIEDRKQLIAFSRVRNLQDHMSRLRGQSADGTVPEAPGDKDPLVKPNAIVPPDNWKGINPIVLPDEEGGPDKDYVFSIGGEGVPMGWYQEQEDGTLIPATPEQSAAIANIQAEEED